MITPFSISFFFSHDPRIELPSCRSIVTIVKLHQLARLCTYLFFYNRLLQYFSMLSKWLYKYYFFYKNITQINSVEIGRLLFFRYSNVFIFFCKHIKRRKPLKKLIREEKVIISFSPMEEEVGRS